MTNFRPVFILKLTGIYVGV